ncbi:MAG: hypothetical protein ABIR65_01255 [Pseudolysinimonas sp.]
MSERRYFVVSRAGVGFGSYDRKSEAIVRVLWLRSVGVDALLTEQSTEASP